MIKYRQESHLFKLILLFRLCIVGAVSVGLFLQIYPDRWHQLTYYTLISNILVLLFYVFLIGKMLKDPKESIESETLVRLKAGMTVAILLTFLVYMILLAPKARAVDFYAWKNYLLHYIVPIATAVDWLLFDKKGCYKKLDPVYWTFVPIMYCVFALVKGVIFRIPIPEQEHSPFPYFFLNIDRYGWEGFFRYFFGILACYMVIGYLMYLMKKYGKRSDIRHFEKEKL